MIKNDMKSFCMKTGREGLHDRERTCRECFHSKGVSSLTQLIEQVLMTEYLLYRDVESVLEFPVANVPRPNKVANSFILALR